MRLEKLRAWFCPILWTRHAQKARGMIPATDDLARIEAQLYATLVPGAKQIKVALLVVRAFPPNSSKQDCPDDETIDRALGRLVTRPDVRSLGPIHRWRHSEIMRLGS